MRLRETSSAIAATCALATAVLAVGGALRWAEAAVAILVALSLLPLLTSRRVLTGTSPLIVIFAIAIAMTALQLVPLPASWVAALDPVNQGLRAEGSAIAHVHPWTAITLDAPGSLHAVAYFTILLGVAAVALRFAPSERGRLFCLGAVAAICAVTAGVVGLHELFDAQALYGLYVPVQATPPVLGPLLNANHLGGLMAMGTVVSVGLLLYTKQSLAARVAWGLTAAGCTVVVLASLSRGALLALLSGIGVTLGAIVGQRLAAPADRSARAQRRRFLMSTLPIGIVVVCTLVIIIFTTAGTAADQLQNTSLQEIHEPKSKFAAWRSAEELLKETPWVGIGRGALEPTFTRVHPASAFVTFSHLENEYIQAVVEWGVPGAIVLAFALGWFAVVAIRRWRDGPLAAAALGGLTTLAVQSNVDFGAELLGVSVPAVVVAATLSYVPLRVASGLPAIRVRVLRSVLLLGLTAAAILLCSSLTRTVAEDHIALADKPTMEEIDASIERHPLDYLGYAVAAQTMMHDRDTEAIAMLNVSLALHPTHSGLHEFAGGILLSTGHIDQAAVEYAAALRGASDPRPIVYEIDHGFAPDKAADAIPVDYEDPQLIARALHHDEHDDIGLAWMIRVVDAHPKSITDIDMLYDLAGARGDYATAEKAVRAKLAVTPNVHSTVQLAELVYKRGDYTQVVKLVQDVATWHGLIDDQVRGWLLLCDAQLALGDLDVTTRCVHHLDASGLIQPAQRMQIVRRLEAINAKRKDQGLIEQWSVPPPRTSSGSAAGSAHEPAHSDQ